MMHIRFTSTRFPATLPTLMLVCASLTACAEPEDDRGIDLAAFGDVGKSDLPSRAKLIDDVGPDSVITGQLDPQVRVYGVLVQARAGARISAALQASAGPDAPELPQGQPLDTILGVYGPYESPSAPGARLALVDDGDGVAAPPVDFEVPADGQYLVAFSSWDEGGTGDYALELACDGSDDQCMRAPQTGPCVPGQQFVGGQISEDTHWERCEVVMLEPVVVGGDAVLTIAPGVSVAVNYLSSTASPFGTVDLRVYGELHAVGTPQHPITFRSWIDGKGWRGLHLRGPSVLEHVTIEHADRGVYSWSESFRASDVVIDGRLGSHRATAGMFLAGDASTSAHVSRTLVREAKVGIHLYGTGALVLEDSVLRNNDDGLRVGRAEWETSCTPVQNGDSGVLRSVSVRHTDFIHNRSNGVVVHAPSDLSIEASNLVDNGDFGFGYLTRVVSSGSFVRDSNIFGNDGFDPQGGPATQVWTDGAKNLDMRNNYWTHLSDPGLRDTWHGRCNAGVDLSGFRPELNAAAGPRPGALSDAVAKSRYFAQ